MIHGLLDYLREFNSKERFFLIGHALGNPQFTPSSDFRTEIANMLGLHLPDDLFSAMDYHLDWLYASLQMNADCGRKRVYPNDEGVIKAQQEDIDFLIGYEISNTYHIIVIEAKGVTGWTNSQMHSKAARFRAIFGEDGGRWAHITPHFIIMSPRKPQRLDVSGWPRWMAPQGYAAWIPLRVSTGLKQVSRCDSDGTPSAQGKFWTVVNR